MKYKARKSFYDAGTRKMIQRGEVVELNDLNRAAGLLSRRLIVEIPEADALGPSETKVIRPTETKQPAQDPTPVQVQAVNDPETVQDTTAADPEEDKQQETALRSPADVQYDLTALTIKELKEEAKRLEITGYSGMNKDELIQTIKEKSKGDE